MKICPECAYANPAGAERCGICGAGLARARQERPVRPARRAWPGLLLLAAGLLLLAAGARYFRRGAPAAAAPAAAPGPAAPFSYDGVLLSAEAQKRLRFLPQEDRLAALDLLDCPDERVGLAAAQLAGGWARTAETPGRRDAFFAELVSAAEKARGQAARQAAVEAGLTAAFGFPWKPYGGRLHKAAAALAAHPDEKFKAAGFFLASMTEQSGLKPDIGRAFRSPSSDFLALHAACALARFGSAEAGVYLEKAAAGRDEDRVGEALVCLSYSALPSALPFLRLEAGGRRGPRRAEIARTALNLRGQLAIINH